MESNVPSCGIVGEDTKRMLWLGFACSIVAFGKLLLTTETGGGEMGIAGSGGAVGVTGVGGMLESLRLS